MTPKLLGIGTALPETTVSQDESAIYGELFLCDEFEETRRLLPKLYRMSGVDERRSVLFDRVDGELVQTLFTKSQSPDDKGPGMAQRMVLYAEHAPKLAIQSSRQALTESDVKAASITHLVTVSCTGFAMPGIDLALIKALDLPQTVQRTHVGFMGCHGAVNGLRIAAALASADPKAVIMVCAVEICSLHSHYGNDREQIVANALFADGSAAAVVAASDDPTKGLTSLAGFGSCLLPGTEEDMTWRLGDNSFEISLSAKVPSRIKAELKPWLHHWLDENSMTQDDIKSWAVHPGGQRILKAVSTALKLEADALAVSTQTLQTIGNLSSPTVLFITKALLEKNPGQPLVMLAFGPGLVAETALLK
ncbi:MAG: type III polyketide synthase [Burkholderiaceae bacterium]